MKVISLDNLFATGLIFLVIQFFPVYFNLDFLDPLSQTIQDFYITDIVFSKIRDNSNVTKDTNIILVNIGNLDRNGIASELEIINAYKPRVVAFDSFFRSLKGNELDEALATALASTDNLVMVSQLASYKPYNKTYDTILTSHPYFNLHAKTGFANFIIEQDYFRTVRTFAKSEIADGKNELSFPLAIAQAYDPASVKEILNRSTEYEIINYKRTPKHYTVFDTKDIFERSEKLELVRNKIVIFGFLGPDTSQLVTEDIFFTPMNSQYLGKSYPDMYGPVIHANIVSMVLERDYINILPKWLSLTLIILAGYFNMALFALMRHYLPKWYEPASIIISLSQIFLLLLIIIAVFYYFALDLNITGAFLVIMLSIPAFETYHDSLKPIAISWFSKLFMKKSTGGVNVEE